MLKGSTEQGLIKNRQFPRIIESGNFRAGDVPSRRDGQCREKGKSIMSAQMRGGNPVGLHTKMIAQQSTACSNLGTGVDLHLMAK